MSCKDDLASGRTVFSTSLRTSAWKEMPCLAAYSLAAFSRRSSMLMVTFFMGRLYHTYPVGTGYVWFRFNAWLLRAVLRY